ncbi:chromate efflux transporter [Paenibacillus mucilaginosus]|uniref:ChrA n=1 Tax=Paenibacillus mucilaginosus 3016 TaxID=1116391 RepID=H6NL21_9BACL|nr:chromate efflux transporter [Paenibacillus mucilaginosus]AFC29728.1 ChrA [Paenibacillus mucilaginosus 3016]MCG7211403.1 chromate efflux transporter [Paenibacillus mucilaginosus]WDM30219.1 chromate efflux transporter [Paenibacillus mucilaginosus]WFA18401.1 chromate efflux transporter [Paenibacillus mucilaginosus]
MQQSSQTEQETNSQSSPAEAPASPGLWKLFTVALRLGLTSFGGPAAHLGYFRQEYVVRRRWIDERTYADLVALCQFLPGPASSQVGMGIGLLRGGIAGALTAWLGFTLPSVLALTLFAFAVQGGAAASSPWLHGLKLVAVAVVAQAVIGMGAKLAPDRSRRTLALLAAAAALLWQAPYSQVALIAAAGLFGLWAFRSGGAQQEAPASLHIPVSRRAGAVSLGLFFVLLIGLPWLRTAVDNPSLALFDIMYRAGSLVFGGGHVVLPLLDRELVPGGWMNSETFLAGYGAAQAVPGPLFTFASYLGAAAMGWQGAVVATLAIFLPAFLLILGALPFWADLRTSPRAQGALAGINAAVVGILLAAWYQPIWMTAVLRPADFAAAALLYGMLEFWKLPPWVVVIAGALLGSGLGYLPGA